MLDLLDRLPEWVGVVGEWIAVVIVGIGGVALIVLICGIIVWFITYMIWLFKSKE